MKFVICFFILSFTFGSRPSISAQINTFIQKPDHTVFKSVTAGGYATFNRSVYTLPENVFRELGHAFDLVPPFDMEIKDITTPKNRNNKHIRFQQTYNGVPVYSGFFVIHKFEDGRMSGNGKICNPSSIRSNMLISEKEALEHALSYINAQKYFWQDSAREAKAKKKQNDPAATYYPKATMEYLPSKDFTSIDLCYAFDIYTFEELKSGKYYVNASDGEVLKFLPANHICSPGSFTSNFYGVRTISTYDNGDEFELEDDCYASVYGVYDENNNLEIFTNPVNTWPEGYKGSAATSLWGVREAMVAYLLEFNRDGHDNDDGDIDIYQNHYFANGGHNNASFRYDPIGDDEINVGRGDDIFDVMDDYNPLDIMGHEFTHGVDQYTAALEYEGESGALDESFADIFGEWVEYVRFGGPDWFVGGDRENGNGCPSPLRYLIDPAAQNVVTAGTCTSDFDQPNTYEGTNWFDINGCTPGSGNDQCGVHTNSGVQNQMFYLLVEGGSGWNNGNTCHAPAGSGYAWDVSGIGMEDAIEIAYHAHVVLMGPTTDFADAREAWVIAATLLFGECSFEAIQTGKAWYAVGFPPPSIPNLTLCNQTYGNNNHTVTHQSSIITGTGCYVNITNGGGTVNFAAGKAVKLNPGFHAVAGSVFIARITECEYAAY